MKLYRLFLTASGLGLLMIGLGGCLKEPSYSTTPEISVDDTSVVLRHYASNQAPYDSVFVTVRFQDGDGDLGLSEADSKTTPYAYPSRFNNNFFIEPYLKTNSGFVSMVSLGRTTAGAYNSRFEPISTVTSGRSAPIKGTLTRGYRFTSGLPFQPGEEIRFQVSIADHAMHESNTVTTNSIPIPNP